MKLHALEEYYHDHTPHLQDAHAEYAVLIPLVQRSDGLHLLYEVRASSLHHHRSEVCFPGGRMESGESPTDAALRETQEELGISPRQIRVFGEADFLHLRSEALMHPVVGLLEDAAPDNLTVNPAEVQSTFTVPLQWLRENPPQVYRYTLRPDVGEDFPYDAVQTPPDYTWSPGFMEVPVYRGLPHPLWGLTARITQHFIDVFQSL